MNPITNGTAVIGVGSSHGDDQFGWAVVDELVSLSPGPGGAAASRRRTAANASHDIRFGKITSPVDVIQELDQHSRLIIVDAAVGLPAGRNYQRLSFASVADRSLMQEVSNHGSHDFGLYLALRLAESLGRRTDHVQIWIGNAERFERFSPISTALGAAVKGCASAISKEWCDARMVVG